MFQVRDTHTHTHDSLYIFSSTGSTNSKCGKTSSHWFARDQGEPIVLEVTAAGWRKYQQVGVVEHFPRPSCAAETSYRQTYARWLAQHTYPGCSCGQLVETSPGDTDVALFLINVPFLPPQFILKRLCKIKGSKHLDNRCPLMEKCNQQTWTHPWLIIKKKKLTVSRNTCKLF